MTRFTQGFITKSGLFYPRARYYDPALGCLISPDPFLGRLAEPSTQNRYVYVKNNPLGYTDPEGFEAQFGKRPLDGMPFMINSRVDDRYNTEISHEQLFFGDGGHPLI